MFEDKTPSEILESAYLQAVSQLDQSFLSDEEARQKIDFVSRSHIGAGVRLLLACSLAKIYDPSVDIRKPFTNLGEGSYSGRSYDENYVTEFINRHQLPCNSTTAFLTPALRTKSVILQPGANLGGRDQRLYEQVITLLNNVENRFLSAENLLCETIRILLAVKQERGQQVSSLLDDLKRSAGNVSLSSEDIVNLIQQHLSLPRASRLPVLVVAAVYKTAAEHLKEQALPLESHTAADERTGALGDVQIVLTGDDRLITGYEMKMKRVTKDDVDRALQKLRTFHARIDNYIFITTEEIDSSVADYARSLYRETGGIEFVILDCVGFLRYFLHLFHRLRLQFVDNYQQFLLEEPESAVSQSLKEAFLALRRAAESAYWSGE
jgi:DNA adenine methylase